MGFLNFFTKNKKQLLLVGGTSLLTLGLIYLFTSDVEEKEVQQEIEQPKVPPIPIKPIIEQQEDNIDEIQAQISKNENLKDLTKEQQRQLIEQTIKLKQEIVQECPLLLIQGTQILSADSVKGIFLRSIFMAKNSLIQLREEYVGLRIREFNNVELYTGICQELFSTFFKVINQYVNTVITLLGLDPEYFVKCQQYLHQNQLLKASYLRDMGWHIMAEEQSRRNLTVDEYKQMLKFQNAIIKIQQKLILQNVKGIDINQLKLFVNCRLDDLTFTELKISDYDQVKHLRFFIKDVEINELIQQKNDLIDQLQLN